jgi:hypothetical protein
VQCFFEGIFVCNQSGNHPSEDLTKYGYKPDTKVQVLNHPFIILAAHHKPNIEI